MSAPRIAVVSGGAEGVWEEHARAVDMLTRARAEIVYVAVNGAGTEHPDPLHHWGSIHPENFTHEDYRWEERRAENGLRCEYERWGTARKAPNVDRRLRTPRFQGGSSGLLGVDVALNGVGCEGAVLAGVGLDERPNPFNPRWEAGWVRCRDFRLSWEKLRTADLARIRSMSGWTREFLGAPTVEWIRSLMEQAA